MRAWRSASHTGWPGRAPHLRADTRHPDVPPVRHSLTSMHIKSRRTDRVGPDRIPPAPAAGRQVRSRSHRRIGRLADGQATGQRSALCCLAGKIPAVMRVLIDTDVLLDVALARRPHVDSSAAVLRWAETGGDAIIAWHSLANCAYLLQDNGRHFLAGRLDIVEVAAPPQPCRLPQFASSRHVPREMADAAARHGCHGLAGGFRG